MWLLQGDIFEAGVEKIRQGIVARTNPAMSRLKLLQQMPQGDRKFKEWSKKIMKQAHRCDWTCWLLLGMQSFLKLMADNMNYDQTVAWDRTHKSSSKKAKQVESRRLGSSRRRSAGYSWRRSRSLCHVGHVQGRK